MTTIIFLLLYGYEHSLMCNYSSLIDQCGLLLITVDKQLLALRNSVSSLLSKTFQVGWCSKAPAQHNKQVVQIFLVKQKLIAFWFAFKKSCLKVFFNQYIFIFIQASSKNRKTQDNWRNKARMSKVTLQKVLHVPGMSCQFFVLFCCHKSS